MTKKPQKDLLFIVRKYVKAKDLRDVLKQEPKTPIHDVWVDDDYKQTPQFTDAIGFCTDHQNEYEGD